jgi:hypothetical protein
MKTGVSLLKRQDILIAEERRSFLFSYEELRSGPKQIGQRIR